MTTKPSHEVPVHQRFTLLTGRYHMRKVGSRMKLKRFLTSLLFVSAMILAGAPASWANSLTFQGVTFGLTDLGSGSLQFTINNAVSGGTGDWADITHIQNFQWKSIGSGTTMSLTGWNVNNSELGANA